MPATRLMNRFARLVLAWFLLALGTAMAAPAVQPQISHMVCSGGSMTVVVQDPGAALAAGPSLDCPLCAAFDAPPPTAVVHGLPSQPPALAVRRLAVVRMAVRSAAPLAARGPPSDGRLA